MINLPNTEKNMRKELNIPKNAVVYGRYGGYEEFDISYVHYVVYTVAIQNPNIYFIFLNTKPFCNPLSNIIHLDKIVDLEKKVEFINTCDAMLWARKDGESFGLAIAEFSTKNKPVIATKVNGDETYIHILGEKALWYDNDHSLYNILMNFNKEEFSKRDWNAYRDYEPEKVMSIFKSVFID
jgi:glycosyltransferase involved in cell wall biosynthesis